MHVLWAHELLNWQILLTWFKVYPEAQSAHWTWLTQFVHDDWQHDEPVGQDVHV